MMSRGSLQEAMLGFSGCALRKARRGSRQPQHINVFEPTEGDEQAAPTLKWADKRNISPHTHTHALLASQRAAMRNIGGRHR